MGVPEKGPSCGGAATDRDEHVARSPPSWRPGFDETGDPRGAPRGPPTSRPGGYWQDADTIRSDVTFKFAEFSDRDADALTPGDGDEAETEDALAAVFETVPVTATLWFTCCDRLMLGSALREYSSSSVSGSFGAVESFFDAPADSDFDEAFEASATLVSLNAPPVPLSTHPITVIVSFDDIGREAVPCAGYVGLCAPDMGAPGAGAWAPSAAQVMNAAAVVMMAIFICCSP